MACPTPSQTGLVNEMSSEVVGWLFQESSLRGGRRAGRALIHPRTAWDPEVTLSLYSCLLLCSDPAVPHIPQAPGQSTKLWGQ